MTKLLRSTLACSVVALLTVSARAAYFTNTPSSPDPYMTTQGTSHYQGAGLAVDLQHEAISAATPQPLPPSGGFTANSFFDVFVDLSANGSPPAPVHLQGTGQIHSNGPGGAASFFDTEMLALNLTGNSPFGPVMIRESPTLQSTGKTSIADQGGGIFRIDSFFDVFTELSVDGGQTWMPDTNGPTHFVGVDAPEPGTLLLIGVGALALLPRRRRA